MKTIDQLKLAWAARKLVNAYNKEKGMYDFKVGAAKALRDLLITSGAVLTAYFMVPDNINTVLGGTPEAVKAALIPLVSSGFVFLHNLIKEKFGKG